MAELIVIGYDTPEKAEGSRSELFGLSKEYLVEVGDAVVAVREPNGKIKLNQMVNLWTVGAAGGSFWGLLAGFLFFNPLLGVVTGAAAGAVAGALNDYGIGDDFMREIADVLQPGQAALFILANRVSSERVIDRLAKHGGRVLRTNLDTTQEQKLRDAFEKAAKSPDLQDAAARAATDSGTATAAE